MPGGDGVLGGVVGTPEPTVGGGQTSMQEPQLRTCSLGPLVFFRIPSFVAMETFPLRSALFPAQAPGAPSPVPAHVVHGHPDLVLPPNPRNLETRGPSTVTACACRRGWPWGRGGRSGKSQSRWRSAGEQASLPCGWAGSCAQAWALEGRRGPGVGSTSGSQTQRYANRPLAGASSGLASGHGH